MIITTDARIPGFTGRKKDVKNYNLTYLQLRQAAVSACNFLIGMTYMIALCLRTICPIVLAAGFLLPAYAAEANYSIPIGDARTGSSLSKGRASLGLDIDVNKSWDELSADEKSLWRKFVAMTDEKITPPFPSPNIRSLLRKLVPPQEYSSLNITSHRADVKLVVHVGDDGVVSAVDILGAEKNGAMTLTDNEKVLAYTAIKALQSTRFSPAKMDGSPVASAFLYQTVQIISH